MNLRALVRKKIMNFFEISYLFFSELQRENKFTDGFFISDTASSTQGTRTLIEYKQITDETDKHLQLREYGLTEEEIEIKTKCDNINVSLW